MQNHNPTENLTNETALNNKLQNNEVGLDKELAKLSLNNQQQQHYDENPQLQIHNNEEDEDYVLIQPAKIWTRPDIEEFKAEVSAGDGDGVITVGHGDTVTVSC